MYNLDVFRGASLVRDFRYEQAGEKFAVKLIGGDDARGLRCFFRSVAP